MFGPYRYHEALDSVLTVMFIDVLSTDMFSHNNLSCDAQLEILNIR